MIEIKKDMKIVIYQPPFPCLSRGGNVVIISQINSNYTCCLDRMNNAVSALESRAILTRVNSRKDGGMADILHGLKFS